MAPPSVTVSPAHTLIVEDAAVGEVMPDLLVEEGFQGTLGRHVLRVRNVSRIRPNLLILDFASNATHSHAEKTDTAAHCNCRMSHSY